MTGERQHAVASKSTNEYSIKTFQPWLVFGFFGIYIVQHHQPLSVPKHTKDTTEDRHGISCVVFY